MKQRSVTAPETGKPVGGFSQAVEVTDARRWLYVSGQVPADAGGQVPATFEAQCRLAWVNVEAQLRAADMSLDNWSRSLLS